MIFNQDSKTIGHYCHVGKDFEEKNDLTIINWILMGIICILIFVAFIFGLWLVYTYKKGRKKRINEIKDEFDYTLENNYKNNLVNKSLGLEN